MALTDEDSAVVLAEVPTAPRRSSAMTSQLGEKRAERLVQLLDRLETAATRIEQSLGLPPLDPPPRREGQGLSFARRARGGGNA
jgi:hypothetical protein